MADDATLIYHRDEKPRSQDKLGMDCHRHSHHLRRLCGSFAGRQYFVSPRGVDTNAGTRQSLCHASEGGQRARTGRYLLCASRGLPRSAASREIRSLRPEITFAGWQDEEVVISGADVINGWENDEGNIYS